MFNAFKGSVLCGIYLFFGWDFQTGSKLSFCTRSVNLIITHENKIHPELFPVKSAGFKKKNN